MLLVNNWNTTTSVGSCSRMFQFDTQDTTIFFVEKSPLIPPPSGKSDSNRLKSHSISGTRSWETWCTLVRKTLEPRRTSAYLSFVDDSCVGTSVVPITVPWGAHSPQGPRPHRTLSIFSQ